MRPLLTASVLFALSLVTPGFAADPAADTPLTTDSRLETTIPVSVRGLMLDQPAVTFLVSVDEHGKLMEHMPTFATHYKLIENAEHALRSATFRPATHAGQPVASTGEVTVSLYDAAQRAYFNGGITQPPPNTASDLVESRLLKIDKNQFAYRSSKPQELDHPLEVTATQIMLYQDSAGKTAAGRCVVEFWVDAQGEPRFPRIVSSDSEAVSTSAILTLRKTRFSTPTRNGLPTFVQVRQPMEFNTQPPATTAAKP